MFWSWSSLVSCSATFMLHLHLYKNDISLQEVWWQRQDSFKSVNFPFDNEEIAGRVLHLCSICIICFNWCQAGSTSSVAAAPQQFDRSDLMFCFSWPASSWAQRSTWRRESCRGSPTPGPRSLSPRLSTPLTVPQLRTRKVRLKANFTSRPVRGNCFSNWDFHAISLKKVWYVSGGKTWNSYWSWLHFSTLHALIQSMPRKFWSSFIRDKKTLVAKTQQDLVLYP